MLRKIFAMLLFVLAVAGGAAETKPQGFSAHIIPTKAVNIKDQFVGILPGRPPFIPRTVKAVCGEPFSVQIVFSGAEAKNGSVSLTGKISFTAPNGKKTVIPMQKFTMKPKGDMRGVFLLPQNLQVSFDPPDPKGNYTFELALTDCNAEKTATASASVEYVENIPVSPEFENLDKLFDNYYRTPCPQNIVSAFQSYLKRIPAQKQKEKQNFNPLPQLAFFCFVLKDNPQCVPAFAELFKKLHNEEKFLAGVVLNFASGSSAKTLDPNQRKAIGKQFPADPFAVGKVAVPWQLDVCWAEFLVRGTKAPVMKVVNALTLAKDSISIADYKKLAKPTREDRRKLMNGLTAMAAQWSLNSLAKTHPLIRYYVEAALVRGEVKDPVAGALAAKAVGIPVKLGNGKKP